MLQIIFLLFFLVCDVMWLLEMCGNNKTNQYNLMHIDTQKMKKVGLPPPSIRNKMIQDKIDEYWICTFFGEPVPRKKGASGGDEAMDAPPGGKPDMKKYERMKKVGLPAGSVRNKMIQDQIHEYWICTFFGEPVPRKQKSGGKGGKGKKGKSKKRKVKPLHWRKKSDCKWDQTIWGDLKTISPESVFTPEFQVIIEKSFAILEKKKKDPKDKKSKAEKKEADEIAILDGKRSFSMVVGLKAFQKAGMQDNDIRDAMLKLDDTVMCFDSLFFYSYIYSFYVLVVVKCV